MSFYTIKQMHGGQTKPVQRPDNPPSPPPIVVIPSPSK